jgi:hypothetical protein
MNVEEYAKAKGIPVGSIPVREFRKAQQEAISLRQPKESKAAAFLKLCSDTKSSLEKCAKGVSYTIVVWVIDFIIAPFIIY